MSEPKTKYDIAFLCYDLKDASFFCDLAKHIESSKGKTSVIISYTRLTDQYLSKRDQAHWSMSERGAEVDMGDWETGAVELERKYGLTSLRVLTNHEKTALYAKDEQALVRQAYRYFRALERFFAENKVRHAVHEIGGWLGNRSLEMVSQKHECDNVYIEPSMFRGRIIMFRNSFLPVIPRLHTYGELSPEDVKRAEGFIESSVKTTTVIMPFKDISKYKDVGLGFAFNLKNFRNALKGIHRRYVVNKGEELVAPLPDIAMQYVKRAMRRKFLARSYSRPVEGEKYLYYPLHMPIDMQILVRSPQFFDQYYLIEYIARMLPQGYKLYFKEHPVSIGMYDYPRMRALTKIPNVRLIDPRVNSHPIIARAKAVITVNSKVGFEALYHRKPVITLGDSFYRNRGLTLDVDDLAKLDKAIQAVDKFQVDREKLVAFVHTLYEASYAGELYQNQESNYSAFGTSLLGFLGENNV